MKRKLSIVLICTLIITLAISSVGFTYQSKMQKPVEITATYLTLGPTPKDLNVVQDAVNKIIENAIGVKLKFYTIGAMDTFTKYGTLIATGEKIDLMMLVMQPIENYINNGAIIPLNSAIASDGKDLTAFNKKYACFDTIKGKTYGITPIGSSGNGGAIIMKKSLFDDAGLTLKKGNALYSLSDLTKVFAAVKKANPKIYPYGVVGKSIKATLSSYSYFNIVDVAGANLNSGVLLGTKSVKLVDLFETPEYYNFLKTVRQWHDAGYTLPDAATNETAGDALVTAGVTASYPLIGSPGMVSNLAKPWKGAVGLNTTAGFVGASKPSMQWIVPISSENPKAAVRFLDYMYTHDNVANLICFGIEGQHYKVIDKQNGVIDYANGLNAQTTPYNNSMQYWGNAITAYSFNSADVRKADLAYSNACRNNPTKAYGFIYTENPKLTNVSVAVDTVLNQYMPPLETGSVKNMDEVYKEFISKLKAAGINKLIADKQAQLNAWLTKKK